VLPHEYVCVNDDAIEGLEGFEFVTIASTEEGARLNAQDAFPHARVCAIHEKGYLDWADALGERAKKMRALEKPLKGPLEEMIHQLSAIKKLPSWLDQPRKESPVSVL